MDLGALYQDVILDHNKSPRNWGEMSGATCCTRGHNPLCGDRLALWVRLDGDTIADISFTAEGCAISKASASMMTQAVKGRTRAEADALFARFHEMVTGAVPAPDPSLGRLKVLAGVARFPTRVKCASLAWHALRDALQDGSSSA